MKKHKGAYAIGVIPLAAMIFLFPWIFKSNENNIQTMGEDIVTVHFIDVGQGDCTLIELPEDKFMLIDAGDNGKENVILNYLDEMNVTKIDYLVATHPHADHIGGMPEIIEKYDIGQIFMPNAEASSKTFENMLDVIEDKNLYINTAYAGKNIFDYSGIKADIISPEKDRSYNNLNNCSAVVKLECGEKSFLFMGDAEKEIEDNISDSYAYLKSDVLKVGHHGSSTSSEYEFIKKVSPEYAVISCGKDNTYGHPHTETIDNLKKVNAEVLRTDELGTIKIETDGKNLAVKR